MPKTLKKPWLVPALTVILKDWRKQSSVLVNCKLQLVIPGDPHNYQYGYCWDSIASTCSACLQGSQS
ncbi:MAG: hypothetical protein PHN59_04615 [Candidatus Omnitrophica bacterium]|nr:hypothetical protein [Candidatus Omnitrophota bacterium]